MLTAGTSSLPVLPPGIHDSHSSDSLAAAAAAAMAWEALQKSASQHPSHTTRREYYALLLRPCQGTIHSCLCIGRLPLQHAVSGVDMSFSYINESFSRRARSHLQSVVDSTFHQNASFCNSDIEYLEVGQSELMEWIKVY